MMLAVFFEPFDPITVQLSVINSLSSDAFVSQEIQEFIPGDLTVVFAVTLVDQSPQCSCIFFRMFWVFLDALFKFSRQILFHNSMVLHGSMLG